MSPTTTFRSLSIVLSALTLLILPACDNGAKDEVRAVFDAYNEALRAHNGDAFLKLIEPQNIKHYGHFVDIARTGDRATIERLSWGDKAEVTLIRNRFSVEELAKMDGTGYVRTCVNRGWFFMEEDGERFTLGMITIKPPRASAALIVDGDKTDLRFEFVEVEGQWLVNDECMANWYDRYVELSARINGMSEDTYILAVEARESGKKVTRAIWDSPPK